MRLFLTLAFALALASSAIAQDNYVIIVDTSGSMSNRMRSVKESRMDVAKTAMKKALAPVPEGTNIGIYTFNGWAYPISPLNRDNLNSAIDSISTAGGTPLYEAIRDSATEFLKFRANQRNVGTYKIIVVTDGEANDQGLNSDGRYRDGTPRPGVVKDVMMRGIIIDTIGLDMDRSHSLKDDINGFYMSGDNPETLQQSIAKSIAEVTSGQDADGDAFEVVKEFSDSFAHNILVGLTTYQNHPIGEKPFVPVVQEDGTIQMQPQPSEASTGGVGTIILFVFIGLIIVVVLLVVGVKVLS